MAVYPAVIGYRDGEEYPVNAEELNKPINQLKSRTDYLKSRVDLINDQGLFNTIQSSEVIFYDPDLLSVGSPVYLRPEDNKYAPAQATVITEAAYSYTYADMEAFVVGVVSEISGNRGRVSFYGKQLLNDVNLATVLEPGEEFRNGPYYLSPLYPGKITKAPKGPAVYLGIYTENPVNPGYGLYVHIQPQMKDLFESHLHKSFILTDAAAGTITQYDVDVPEIGDFKTRVDGFLPDDPVTPVCTLHFRGAWTGSGNPQYTFWILNSTTAVEDALLYWTTDDDSSENLVGVPIVSYDTPVELGNGIQVIVSKLVSDLATADMRELAVGAVKADTNTWTIPDFVEVNKGWITVTVREDLVGDPDSPPVSDCPAKIIGEYINPDGRLSEILLFVASGNGDLALDTVAFDIYDSTATLVDSIAGVGLGTPVYSSVLGLWIYFLNGSTTDVFTGETWVVSFSDEAPDASFEYNIGFDKSLNVYYPPNPFLDLVFETNGVTQAKHGEYRTGDGSCYLTARTIFWVDNQNNYAPFYDDTIIPLRKNHKLYSTVLRAAETGLVTSIVAAEGSQVEVIDAVTGEPASTGNLALRIGINISVQNTNKTGFRALKGVDANGALVSGPMVEKIVAGDNVTITKLDAEAPAGQGTLRISSTAGGISRSMFTDVTLHNAKQELVPNSRIPYIKLKGWTPGSANNIPTGFTLKFRVPYTLTQKYRLALYFTMFGLQDVAGGASPDGRQYAGLKMTYSVVPDFTSEASPGTPVLVTRNLRDIGVSGVLQGLIDIPNDVPFGVGGVGYAAYDPFLFHNDGDLIYVDGQVSAKFGQNFPAITDDPAYLTSGDIVTVRVDRADPQAHSGTEVYVGDIGFVANEWKLLEV